MSTNAEDSDEGDEEERLQTGPLLGLGRSAKPMGRGRPFDDDGRSLLPLFRLLDDSTVLHVGAVARRMLMRSISRNAAYAKQTMFDALFRPSVTERFERFSLHATSTTMFDQRSTGHAIQMLRGTAGQRSYDSSTRKRMEVDFGCQRHRATWSPHHDRWNGRRQTSRQRQSVDSSSERKRNTAANEPVADRRKLMNGHDGIEDRLLFNADRMLMTFPSSPFG